MTASVAVSTSKVQFPEGHLRMNLVTVTGDSSYSAGGYTITAAQCGLKRIVAAVPGGAAFGSATTGYAVLPVIGTNGANVAVRLLNSGATAATTVALTETTTANQSATTITLLVIGV